MDPAARQIQEVRLTVKLSGGTRLLLLGMLLCLAVVSCRPADTRTTGGSGSLRQTGSAETQLSREQIIEAANAVALEHGWWPKTSRIFYDEGNAIWAFHWEGDFQDELAGHAYQAVIYRRLPGSVPFGGDHLWVTVDRNTGAILKVIAEP